MNTTRPNFDEIKKQADLVKVMESYGVTLKKQGADFVGLCPFHEDHKPSLHVTPAKQLWNCPACGAGGNALQFVAKREGCTEKEAAVKLLAQLPGVMRGSEVEPSKVLCDPMKHGELFAAIIAHYHECLLGKGKRGLDYMQKRGLGSVDMLAHFKVGYVDGSLKKKLSAAQLAAAKECGLINDKGNEKFYQRVVVPVFDEHGKPCGLYGRDVTGESSVIHLYLAGPHRAVWNAEAARAYPDNLIITEAIFDALALWCAGQKNVIACYGAGGWTPHHETLIGSAGVRRVTFAFDADAKGEERAKAHAQALDAKGIACHLIEWPQGVHDANDYFRYEQQTGFRGTAESFAALLAKAPRFGFKVARSVPERIDDNHEVTSPPAVEAAASPRVKLIERTDEASVFQNGMLNYRVKGLGNSGSLRVVLTAMNADTRHVDQLDLYGARARRGFAAACAERFTLDAEKIEGDLLALVEALERLQHEAKAAPSPSAQAAPMSNAEREAALAWLKRDNLLEAIAEDLGLIGYVGEPRNKKLAYLIATSRLLPKPLSGIFRAQSGCGKSYLMECVAELMPPEEVHYFSRLTPQALYYLEADALKHKLLIVDERDGSEESEYPIRTLQTRRVLKLAVPVKDPNSGKIKTTVLEIHGPIAYMESTTDAHINPENANRCFELYLDESEQQTKAIFAAQRKARTLDGWRKERHKAEVLKLHHQRKDAWHMPGIQCANGEEGGCAPRETDPRKRAIPRHGGRFHVARMSLRGFSPLQRGSVVVQNRSGPFQNHSAPLQNDSVLWQIDPAVPRTGSVVLEAGSVARQRRSAKARGRSVVVQTRSVAGRSGSVVVQGRSAPQRNGSAARQRDSVVLQNLPAKAQNGPARPWNPPARAWAAIRPRRARCSRSPASSMS